MASKRTRTLLSRHGNDFFSRIGKKGYQTTCDRYFAGNREAMNDWLVRMGRHVCDVGLPYHKPEIYGHPGCHPAWIKKQADWLIDAQVKISPDFPPFRDD